MNAITDQVLVVRAADNCGASAYNFATIRITPQATRVNFLLVYVKGDFVMANQSLSTRIRLVQKLGGFGVSSNPSHVYVAEFREGSIGVLYANLSISDFDCEAFRIWAMAIYAGGNYTQQFTKAIQPFVAAKAASLVGPCAAQTFNITPELGSTFANISSLLTTETTSLLEAIIPLMVVAFLLIAAGIIAILLYRYHRPERRLLYDAQSTYTNRKPVYLDGELNLPTRRRRPMFIQGEQAPLTRGEGSNLLDGGADFSDEDDELVNVDLLVLRPPSLQHASTSPPYRLPPICESRTGQLAHRSMDCSGLSDVEDGASMTGVEASSEEEGSALGHSPPTYRLPECARLS